MSDYDKELINSRIVEVCDYYAPGESWREGQKRRKWYCPVCGGGNFTANSGRQCAGCLSAGCEVPRTKDAVGLIAYFEGLDESGEQFVRCLKKGYEILGIPEPEDGFHERREKREDARTSEQSPQKSSASNTHAATIEAERPARKFTDADPQATDTSSVALLASLQNGSPDNGSRVAASPEEITDEVEELEAEEQSSEHAREPDPQRQRELVDRVYRAFLELCPLVERDREFWTSRGVTEQTMQRCGFGSLWRERCWELLPEMERRFGRDDLVSVPGFYVSKQGRVHTNLYDDYTLIPYHDRDGYITMVQGRVPGQPEKGKPKYVAPVGSGLHLYVPPGYRPEQVVAFCEGAVGAIVAAQSGIPVAAITGFQCYRIAGAKGEADRPLPEHERTDFAGRKVVYLPDEDVKPKTKADVLGEAPKAARFLIEAHGGTAFIAGLPDGYKDLDEWLLSMEQGERIPRFTEVMKGALTPEQWAGEEKSDDRPTDGQTEDGTKEGQEQDGEVRTGPTNKKANKRQSQEVHQAQERNDEDDTSEMSSQEDDYGQVSEEPGPEEESPEETGTPAPRVKTPEPQPRTYRRVPITNIGEFMVALICGLGASLGFLLLVVFAAPAWEPAGFIAALPVEIKLLAILLIAGAIVIYMCHRQYLRRCVAIRNHLAGKR